MRFERDDAKVGLLVLAALALFLGLLFHRMIRGVVKREVAHIVRIESVADLPVGTEVQLLGLRVGEVKAIEMRRDGIRYHFHVTLGLRPDIVLWQGTRAVVSTEVLGGSHLELLLPDYADRKAELKPGDAMEGWTASSLGDLVVNLNALVKNLDAGVDELRKELQTRGLGALLEHPRLRGTFLGMEATLGEFRTAARGASRTLAHGDRSLEAVDRSLASLEKSLGVLGTLLERRSPELDSLVRDLAATLQEMKGLAASLNGVMKTAAPEADATLRTLHRDLKALEELLELLKQKPSRIVWGTPSEAERARTLKQVEGSRKPAQPPEGNDPR